MMNVGGGGGDAATTSSTTTFVGQKIDTTSNPKPVIKNIAPHTNVAHRCLSHSATPSSPMSSSSSSDGPPSDNNVNKTSSSSSSSPQQQGYVMSSSTNGQNTSSPHVPSKSNTSNTMNSNNKTSSKNNKAQESPAFLDFPLKPVKPSRDPALAPLDESEVTCRRKVESRGPVLFVWNSASAFIVFFACIFSYESLLSVALSVGMTCYVYFVTLPQGGISWSMDWTLLGFAVVTPMSISIGLAFRRRELALQQIARFRSSCFQIYLAHATWDWGSNEISGRDKTSNKVNWFNHSDDALRDLIGMADELCRFLTLPSFSRARHRVTPWGRHEASRTVEVAYRLWDSLLTTRVSRISYLTEILKKYGMPGNESSRIRQWERFVVEAIEQLRILKTYRTPQALRSFARLFTIILPGFYSPEFAQLAQESNSLGLGLTFAVLTSFALSALFESIYMLEDPFVAHLSLDGIDVHEELRVLHWHQLINTRQIFFPNASPYVDKFSSEFIMSPKIKKNKQQKTNSTNENPNVCEENGSIEHDGCYNHEDDGDDYNKNHTMNHKHNAIVDASTMTEHSTASNNNKGRTTIKCGYDDIDDDANDDDAVETQLQQQQQRPSSSSRSVGGGVTSNSARHLSSALLLDREEPNPNSNTPSMTRESSYAHFRQSSLTSPIKYSNGEKGN